MHNNINPNEGPSVLAALRAVVPERNLTFNEALRVAELQANRLRELLAVDDATFPTELIAELSRLRVVEQQDLPVSGASYWSRGVWIIALNGSEPRQRRRLTTLHELKHIIDHGRASQLYPGNTRTTSERQAEQAADFFAGCVLVPNRHLKRAFGEGLRRPSELAELFDVSARAIDVRLAQVGLSEPRQRCQHGVPGTSSPSGHPYFRLRHGDWLTLQQRGVPA